MGKLTSHALDTMQGLPAAGMVLTLRRQDLDSGAWEELITATTNDDGRTDTPLLEGEDFSDGYYEISFQVGDYYRSRPAGESLFLDEVPIRFCVADAAQNYHVPLVCTPWSYSTYRGS